MTLPQDKIKERAISESYKQTEGAQCTEFTNGYRIGFQIGHEAGATEWAEKAQPVIDALDELLKQLPTGNTLNLYFAKEQVIKTREELAKYKEVTNG